MNTFINRTEELSFLEKEYACARSSLIVLYGRRRVGKTALAAEFMKNKNAVYFLATEENEIQNRADFRNIIADYSKNELLTTAVNSSWDMIFKVWLETGYNDMKKLMIIDEFQYLGKSNKAFPSIFQRIWDTLLQDKNVMVILCGSLISMMESQTLNYAAPLYGRRTGQIKLKQIPFRHYNEFFEDKDYKELIGYYSVTGGVPKYIKLFADSDDIFDAIENNIIEKQSFLYDEPNFLLQREVNEIGSYFSIVKAIAAGNRKLSKLAAALEIKQTSLTKYLRTLINLDVLEREVPVTEQNPGKSKRGLYRIKDNYMAFWFKFIYPNLSYIESGQKETVKQKIRENLTDAHIAYVYEDICLEKVRNLLPEELFGKHFTQTGRWWSGDTEIDIVAVNSDTGDILFGECKYRIQKTDTDVLHKLEHKGQMVNWMNNARNNYYIIFSISGFTDRLIELAEVRDDLLLMS